MSKVRAAISHPLIWILLLSTAWRGLFFAGVPLIATNDSDSYYRMALGIFSFDYASWFDVARTPIYPLFLGAIFALAGQHPIAIIVAQSALGLLSVAVYYWLAQRVAGMFAAVLTGLYIGLHPALLAFEHTILSETLALLLQGGVLLLVVRAFTTMSLRTALSAGVVAALAALCRSNYLLLLLATTLFGGALALYLRQRGDGLAARRIAGVTAVMFVSACLLMSPWFIDNLINRGRFALPGLVQRGRIVFALREGFLHANDPELTALVPDLPQRCEQAPADCGWLPLGALDKRGLDIIQVEAWAGDLMSRTMRARPADYLQTMWQVALRQTGFIEGGWREVIYVVASLANQPADYSRNMESSVHTWRPAWFAQPERFGPSREPIIWAFEHIWIWRLPVVTLLLLFGLPGTLMQRTRPLSPIYSTSKRGLLLVALTVLVMMSSLTVLLAPVDRYMLLLEPLMWLVGWGGLLNMLSSTQRYRSLRQLLRQSQ